MKIEFKKLEEIMINILGELQKRGIDNVPLDADFYWNVPSDAIYDPYNEPSLLDIGQLEDDYETLLNAKKTDSFIGYNLKNLSSILRYISEKHPD
ncbi:hypothetical protein [Pseudomonas graminis]